MTPITRQAVGSPTFKPPIEMSLSLPGIIEYNAEHSPKHPMYRYDRDGAVHDITYLEVKQALHRAGSLLSARAGGSLSGLTIAILAAADTITYASVILGIIRAGGIPFPISPRNSPVALAHLLKTAKCDFVVVSSGIETIAGLVSLASKNLDDAIKTVPMPTFWELYQATGPDAAAALPTSGKLDLDSIELIIHSSGSTSLPKVIPYTHRFFLEFSRLPYTGEIDLCGQVLSCHALPLFHLMGLAPIGWSAFTGLIVGVFGPTESPAPPSPQSVLSASMVANCTIIFSVPAFAEAWANDPDAVEFLRGRKITLVAGGPLQQDVGDFLVSKGVNLGLVYGTTEVGSLGVLMPEKPPREGWNWLKCSPHAEIKFVPCDGLPDVYLIYVKNTPKHPLAITNTTIDGEEWYNTKDLAILHPTNPKVWRLYGRDDDQITHSTGEKTNPVPIENIITKDPRVAKAVMFGRAQFQAGVIVEPSPPYAFNPKDQERLAVYRNEIWATVNKANENAPRHSRIFKEMILVADPNKPFELTPKGTPKRQQTLDRYAQEIQDAYRAVEGIQRSQTIFPEDWSINHIAEFVRGIVVSVVDKQIKDSDDLFQFGADSLSAVSIRASIVDALRRSGRIPLHSIMSLPTSLVYDLPTIQAISACIYGILLASPPQQTLTTEQQGRWHAAEDEPTVVKIRTREGEPPLIILPGAGGGASVFLQYKDLFDSSIWALQVTKDTPYTSVNEQAAFYYRKIKEEQPRGPYRLAGYSGSAIVVVYLAQIFEDAGDEVAQLAFLDHFPALMVEPEAPFPTREEYIKNNTTNDLLNILRLDGQPHVDKLADELGKAFNREEVDPVFQQIAQRAERFLGMVFDTVSMVTPLMMKETLSRIKAQFSVYIAKTGIQLILPETEEWRDLGVKRYVPDAKIIYCEGGHHGFLLCRNLISGLQEGYI